MTQRGYKIDCILRQKVISIRSLLTRGCYSSQANAPKSDARAGSCSEERKERRSNVDRRIICRLSISLGRYWLIQKIFGWLKQTGPLAQVKLRGLSKVD